MFLGITFILTVFTYVLRLRDLNYSLHEILEIPLKCKEEILHIYVSIKYISSNEKPQTH